MNENKPTPTEAYTGLRTLALEVSATDLGLQVGPEQPYGILMEIGYPKAVVTLVAFGEGTASLYFSSGGGIIGAGQHETVRTEALEFVDISQSFLGLMETADMFPAPALGQVRFYVLTPSGLYSGEASEDDLGNRRNNLWPLFSQGQDLITALREVGEL